MPIKQITETHPAGYGVVCPKHGQCARYAMVEQTSADDTIATCDDGQGGRPLFVALSVEKVAAC